MLGDPKTLAREIVGAAEPEEAGDGKEAAAQELIDAVAAKDAAGVVTAFKAMFDLCESEPHEEYEDEE